MSAMADTPKGMHGWLDWMLHVAVLSACLMAMANNQAEPDLWGHVQYGRDALRNGGLSPTATYTYTAEGTPWINHEVLSEYLLALGVDTIGVSGLLVTKSLLGLLVMCLVLRCSFRKGLSPFTAYFISILTATNLTFFWVLRPQLFSFVFFVLLLTLLQWCFEGWEGNWQLSIARLRKGREPLPLNYSSSRMRWLWLAPMLLFVWANTHGAFLAGLCLFAAYLTLRAFEAVSCRGKDAIGLLKRFAMMIAASLLATMVNPYGVRLHIWLVQSLIAPRPEIVEWLPPPVTWEVSSLAFAPFWLLVLLGAVALILSNKPKDFTHLVLLGLLIIQALEHRRHIAIVAMVFAFWMPQHVSDLLRRLGAGRDAASFSSTFSPRLRWCLAGTIAIALAFMGINLFQQCRMICVRKDSYPVSAFKYIADQRLQGKMVITFDWAQYGIMAFGAETKRDEGLRFHFDGRYDTCYPMEIVDMNFDFEMGDMGRGSRYRVRTSPPAIDGGRLLSFNQPDLLLVARHRPEPQKILAQQSERWVLLYQDKIAQLWGCTNKYDDSSSPDFVPTQQRLITEDPQEGIVAWPALPVRSATAVHFVSTTEMSQRTMLHFPESAQ